MRGVIEARFACKGRARLCQAHTHMHGVDQMRSKRPALQRFSHTLLHKSARDVRRSGDMRAAARGYRSPRRGETTAKPRLCPSTVPLQND